MKRVLLLSLCIVASSVLVAQAADMPSWLTSVRSASTVAGYDQVDYSVIDNGFPTGVVLGVLEGTWTSTDGLSTKYDGKMLLNKSTGYGTWRDATAIDKPLSHVQFPANGSSSTPPVFSRVGAVVGSYFEASSFTGSWYTDDGAYKGIAPTGLNPDGDPLPTLLASILVSHNQAVSFVGQYGWLGNGALGGLVTPARFGSAPEPGTLLMLASGLIGAIAMWVRRRRA